MVLTLPSWLYSPGKRETFRACADLGRLFVHRIGMVSPPTQNP